MRSTSILASIALAACGSSAARGPARPGPAPAAAHTPESVCRALADAAERCPQIGSGRVEVPRCVRSLEEASSSPRGQRMLKESGTCLAEQTACDPLLACLATAIDSNADKELRACDDHDRAELRAGIPRAEYEKRNGAGVTAFRDARSTKATPIEMCGFSEAKLWLVSLRCDDGSQPLRDRADAEQVRTGNVGVGGRCGAIVDRYLVPCPEAKYEIFIDSYICAAADP